MIIDRDWTTTNEAARPSSEAENHATRNANGTGAYRVTSRDPGVRTTLAPFEDWWDTNESIETPALSYTAYKPSDPADPENPNDPADPAVDLVSRLVGRLAVESGLKVVICIGKEVPVGRGYETFAARAYDRRRRAFDDLKAVDPDRVVLFHPSGFPGRPLRLTHTLVAVDDIWLYLGSGSITRRALTFDENLSLALVDRRIEAGRSAAIRNLRRRLMEVHLGTLPAPGAPVPDFPHPNRTRVADLHEAFFAFHDTLQQGGGGLIEPLLDGIVTGQPPIPPDAFPHRDIADPDGQHFAATSAALFQLFAGLGEAGA